MIKQHFKRNNLLFHRVTPIINQNINWRYCGFHLFKKFSVRLGSYKYLNVFLFQRLTQWIDIYTIDFCMGAKIVLPHLETSSVRNTDFEYDYFFIPKPGKMPLVNIKIVNPFMDKPAVIIPEIFF